MNVSPRRHLLSILGTTLLVVQPFATTEIGAQANTDSQPISGPGSAVSADAAPSEVDPRIPEAHDLFADHLVVESLQLFEEVIDEYPEMYEALWGAARSAVAQGFLSGGREIQKQWFKIAESYARRGTELEPDSLEALYWLLSAKGLQAVRSGGREASDLSSEVYDLAHQVLAMDSLHAGAHHALGVLNYRVRRLSGFERFIARNFLGGRVIGLTSWEDAERYLTRATELRPEYILFRLDLGRLYAHRDRIEEARAQFRRVLELPILEPPDWRFQEMAERQLELTFN